MSGASERASLLVGNERHRSHFARAMARLAVTLQDGQHVAIERGRRGAFHAGCLRLVREGFGEAHNNANVSIVRILREARGKGAAIGRRFASVLMSWLKPRPANILRLYMAASTVTEPFRH